MMKCKNWQSPLVGCFSITIALAGVLVPLHVSAKPDQSCQVVSRVADAVTFVEQIDDDIVTDFFPSNSTSTAKLSPVCLFEASGSEEYTGNKKQLQIVFRGIKTEYRPFVSLWDDEKQLWKRIPTVIDRSKLSVTADIPQSGIAAVFADTRDSYEGVASWYAHKRYPNGAATNLFPLGTKLKITNTKTGKAIQATVTSTWTQTDSKRVVDIVSNGFKKLASLSTGLIRVRIEKI